MEEERCRQKQPHVQRPSYGDEQDKDQEGGYETGAESTKARERVCVCVCVWWDSGYEVRADK